MRQDTRDLLNQYQNRIDDLVRISSRSNDRVREFERHNAILRMEVTKLNRTVRRKNRYLKNLKAKLGEFLAQRKSALGEVEGQDPALSKNSNLASPVENFVKENIMFAAKELAAELNEGSGGQGIPRLPHDRRGAKG